MLNRKSLLLVLVASALAHLPTHAGTWTERNLGKDVGLADLLWDGSKFIAGGQHSLSGVILTSADGIDWIESGSSLPTVVSGIAQSGANYVAVGEGMVLKSSDGQNWTVLPPSNKYNYLRDVTVSRGGFLAVGIAGRALTSKNGSRWLKQHTWNRLHFKQVAYSPERRRFVAISIQGYAAITTNGKYWVYKPAAAGTVLNDILWDGMQFVAVGDNGTVLTSPNGLKWSYSYMGADYDLLSIAWSGSEYLAVGTSYTGYTIQVSTDLQSWTEVVTGTGTPGKVAWGNGRFVVVGAYDFTGTYIP